MSLKLFQVGEPVLRGGSRELSREEILSDSIQQLISQMRETLREAPGVGLAAPQVGMPIQLAIVEDLPEYSHDIPESELAARERRPIPFHVIINPRLKTVGDAQAEFFEGCLSLDGFTALVGRAREVAVECLNQRGEPQVIKASGWYARILQHEIDHLNGTLYIDRMHTRTFMSLENYKLYWKGERMEEVKRKLGERRVS
jgi:peptide deformylase